MRVIAILFFTITFLPVFSQRTETDPKMDSLRFPIMSEMSLSYYYNRIAGVSFSIQQFSAPEIKMGIFLGRGFLCHEATLHSVLTYHYFTSVPGHGISYGIRVTTPGKVKGGLGFHYGLFFTSADYELLFGMPEVFLGFERWFLAFEVNFARGAGHTLGRTYLGIKKDMSFSVTYSIPLIYQHAPKIQYKRKYWNTIKNGSWQRLKDCLN